MKSIFHVYSTAIAIYIAIIRFLPLFDHEQLNYTSRNLEKQKLDLSICGHKRKGKNGLVELFNISYHLQKNAILKFTPHYAYLTNSVFIICVWCYKRQQPYMERYMSLVISSQLQSFLFMELYFVL